jgi:hypothetical protein
MRFLLHDIQVYNFVIDVQLHGVRLSRVATIASQFELLWRPFLCYFWQNEIIIVSFFFTLIRRDIIIVKYVLPVYPFPIESVFENLIAKIIRCRSGDIPHVQFIMAALKSGLFLCCGKIFKIRCIVQIIEEVLLVTFCLFCEWKRLLHLPEP